MKQYIKYLIVIFMVTMVVSCIGLFMDTDPIKNNPNYILRKNGIKESDIILKMDIIDNGYIYEMYLCNDNNAQDKNLVMINLMNDSDIWMQRYILRYSNITILPYNIIRKGKIITNYVIGGQIKNDMNIVVENKPIVSFDKSKVIDNYTYFIHDLKEGKEYSIEHKSK